jgi:hypothetical protein
LGEATGCFLIAMGTAAGCALGVVSLFGNADAGDFTVGDVATGESNASVGALGAVPIGQSSSLFGSAAEVGAIGL